MHTHIYSYIYILYTYIYIYANPPKTHRFGPLILSPARPNAVSQSAVVDVCRPPPPQNHWKNPWNKRSPKIFRLLFPKPIPQQGVSLTELTEYILEVQPTRVD